MMLAISTVYLLGCSISAQATEYPLCPAGELIAPTNFGSIPLSDAASQADHLICASNDYGDVMVVWQSDLNAGNSGGKKFQVEGCLLRREPMGNDVRWQTTGNIVFGDPTLELWQDPTWIGGFSNSDDGCFKPTVVGVGDNFIVTWPRVDTSQDDRKYVIEVALVVPSSAPAACPTVVRPSEGMGYLLWDPAVVGSPQFCAGESGETLGITRMRGGSTGIRVDAACVVHIDDLDNSTDGENDYAIHGWDIEFVGASGPPLKTRLKSNTSLVHALVDEFYVDEVNNTGGRVPPFVRETKAGGLVLSYDVMDNRGSSPVGKIMLELFSKPLPTAPNEFIALDSGYFQNAANPEYLHRRSNIAADYDTTNENYLVAWLEIDAIGNVGSTGHLGFFGVDQVLGIINPVVEYSSFVDPSADTQDARALFNESNPGVAPGFQVLVGVNQLAPFEVFAWDSDNGQSSGTYDYDFVPQPTTPLVTEPRRPAIARIDGDPMVIVFDAKVSGVAFHQPIFYVRP